MYVLIHMSQGHVLRVLGHVHLFLFLLHVFLLVLLQIVLGLEALSAIFTLEFSAHRAHLLVREGSEIAEKYSGIPCSLLISGHKRHRQGMDYNESPIFEGFV